MNAARQANEEQATLWNGVAGRAWVEMQALLDQVMKPFERLLADAVAERSPARVLDVGCGTGATTIAAARVVGSGGSCLGVDVSEPMIELARTRAEREGLRAEFVLADAQTHAFAPRAFEMIISRIGVMFFDDPIAAFANLRRAATGDAELRCLTWRGAAENPFMLVAERAAASLLPNIPPRDPNAPGQFAFAEPRRTDPRRQRMGRRPDPARRCRLPFPGERAGALVHATRPARPRVSRGRWFHAESRHRIRPVRLRSVPARQRDSIRCRGVARRRATGRGVGRS
jgi:SAM-dependent methyltransferase